MQRLFESLLARNKARLQALIAVARKLLHAIWHISEPPEVRGDKAVSKNHVILIPSPAEARLFGN
jgi:hypothetical protein